MAVGEFLVSALGAVGFDPELLARYGPGIAKGLWTTLELVGFSVPLGFALAIPLAIARVEGGRVLSGAIGGFTTFFRGTPLIAQLYLLYYGTAQFHVALQDAGIWPLVRDGFWCAAMTFTLNTAAYQAEILRGAIRSVPSGQREAGQALGLGPTALYRLVLLPQALQTALRPLGNELILMIKASSLASVITVIDVMGATKRAFSFTLDFQFYLLAALIYLVLVEIVRRVWNALERRMTRHLAPV